METQQFSNHVKKHPLFHQFIVPVSLLLVAASLTNAILAFSLQALIMLVTTILLHLIALQKGTLQYGNNVQYLETRPLTGCRCVQ